MDKYKCTCAVYMYADITVLPNKQSTSNPVQTGNTSTNLPTRVTGPTAKDGLNTRPRKTEAQVQRRVVFNCIFILLRGCPIIFLEVVSVS